jgi:hypothetical protein
MKLITTARAFALALLGSVLFSNGCTTSVDEPDPAPAENTGTSSAALLACKCTWFGNQNNCDEALNEKGPNRCNSKCECTAGRRCNARQFCEGIADSERCVCDWLRNQNRQCNEAVNKDGPNRRTSDCDCAEGRKCPKH